MNQAQASDQVPQDENLWQEDEQCDQAAHQATVDDDLWSDDEAWNTATRAATTVDDFDEDPEFNVNGKQLYDRREKVYIKRIQRGGL